ncbi:MAG: hypothetical protein D6705_14105 [Deltaproteobacteria bacterium]|nr:MAG: hypothetical protein D6705_14105 [Deltaproteobacteria bacterium]
MNRLRTVFEPLVTADARSLAIVRILLGALLLADLAGRVPHLHLDYTDDGILPAHTLLLAQPNRLHLSYLLTTSRPVEVVAFFTVAALVYLALLAGYRTKLAQLLALVASVSLHTRAPLALHARDLLLDAFLAWTLLLPLGRHLSVDALLRGRPSPAPKIRSLAVLGLWVNVAAVLILGSLHRTDAAWSDGSAVHLLLWQDAIARTPAVDVRERVGPAFSAAATPILHWADLALGVGLLVPVRWVRRGAAAALAVYLLVLSALFQLGTYPLVLFSALPLLIDGPTWERIARAAARRAPRLARALDATPERPSDPGTRVEGLVREVAAAALLAGLLASVAAHNEVLPGWMRLDRPRLASLWQTPLGIAHRWALFGGTLPREDARLVIVATGASKTTYDLLRPGPAHLELSRGRGDLDGSHRIALDLHLRSGWLATVRGDLERLARRAHTLPWTKIEEPIVRIEAIELSRPIPAPGEAVYGPVQRRVSFATAIEHTQKPQDGWRPHAGRPVGTGPRPDPTAQEIAAPIAFDLLHAPRWLRVDAGVEEGGGTLHLVVDSTCSASWLRPARFGALATEGDAAALTLRLGPNRYPALPFVVGVADGHLPDDVDGALCQDFLDLHDVAFDAADRRLVLHPPGSAGTPALPLDGLVPVLRRTTPRGGHGVPIRLRPDLGGLGIFEFHGSALRLSPAAFAALGFRYDAATLELRYGPDGERHFLRHVRIPRLWAGPIFARDRDAVVSDSLAFGLDGLDTEVAAYLGLEAFPAARVVWPADTDLVYLGASTRPLRRPAPTPEP